MSASVAAADSHAMGLSLDVRVPLTARPLQLTLETRSSAVAVVGPSGAGKSTLLRVLAGVERRAVGRLVFEGTEWLSPESGIMVQPWARRVGWVPQDGSLFPHLSVRENLSYSGAAASHVVATSELLEVGHLLDRQPRRLSGGERQRVALGRALLSSPQLLLLDEPFSALDRPLREKLAGTVRRWASERNVPLLLVSHDEQDTEILADERWHLNDGRLSLRRVGQPPAPGSRA